MGTCCGTIINLNRIKPYLCTIEYNYIERLGFFCKLQFPDKSYYLPVIITNYFIIGKDDIINNEEIKIYFNNNVYISKIDKDKKIYTNEEYDITIIEIKQKLNKFPYFDIDDNIDNNIDNNIFNKKNIVIIYYSHNSKIMNWKYKLGSIKKIYDNYIEIDYSNDIKEGDERNGGGLILNSYNSKFLGIEKKQGKVGILIQGIIKDFYNIYNNQNNNTQNSLNSKNKNYVGGSKNYNNNNDNELDTKIIEDKSENNKKNDNNSINNKSNNINTNNNYNPYIKALLISFCKIEDLKNVFINSYNFNKIKKGNISYLISIYMLNYSKNNFSDCENITSELEKQINQINNKILKECNFENLINYILTKLHEELNNKKILNNELPKEDYDENICYYYFKKYYFEQNESKIQEYFYGVKEKIEFFKCCGLKK